MQRRIGLTGGIASGKSSVGRLLEQHGWPVLDADRYARDALAAGSPATRSVLAHFGDTVRARDAVATVDRAALGRIVFSDPKQRRWLEQLLHPLVSQRLQQALAAMSLQPVVVLMVPLLFEAGLTDLCQEVWVVDCSEQQQLQRLMRRDGLRENDAKMRLKAQWPLAEKCRLADRVIDNRGDQQLLEQQIKWLLTDKANGNPAPDQD